MKMNKENVIFENNKNHKMYLSQEYNFLFNKKTGVFYRWGKSFQDDPEYAPMPEIADIEICSGSCNLKCPFCYKKNNVNNNKLYMDINTYKNVLNTINQFDQLTQVALGITTIDSNPDFWKILQYTKKQGIIPNLTSNGSDITPEIAKKLKKYIGAISVSVYKHNKEQALKAIETLLKAKVNQVNIHFLLAENTYDFAFDLIKEIKENKVFNNLNSIVFLSYKHKNENSEFTPLTDDVKIATLLNFCRHYNISYGFDSCFAHKYIKYLKDYDNKFLMMFVEPCESTLFSCYVNVKGEFFPCSFLEGVNEWENGINLLNEYIDFKKDVWESDKVKDFRTNLLKKNRQCPVYSV